MADGSQVDGDIVQILTTEMEAGPRTEVTTGREVITTRHNNDNRQGEDGMKHRRQSHAVDREGGEQEAAT